MVTSSAYIGRAVVKEFPPICHKEITKEGVVEVCTSSVYVAPNISDIPLTINNLAEFELNHVGVGLNLSPNLRPADISPSELEKIDKEVGFSTSRNLLLNARGPNVFPTRTGINVFGARLRDFVSGSMRIDALLEGDGSSKPTVIQINPQGMRQDSIALQFERGSGTVIAGLEGYAATVVVDKEKVVSVSYEQAQQGALDITPTNQRVAQLRAIVATAAKFGVFRIDGPPGIRDSNAAKLADTIRVEKSFDPTLGIYAAYAYAAAGLQEQIRSVYFIMKEEGIELFDVALLADQLVMPVTSRSGPIAPFCPMLNQGWQFLAVKNVTLSRRLLETQAHILPSLWTTFDGEGMNIVKSAVQSQNP
jgi:hypothetical protein